MAKSWKDMSYLERRIKTQELAKLQNIDINDYEGNFGRDDDSKKPYEQLERDVAAAWANDYDSRRSLEAGRLGEQKRFEDLGDITNISSAYDVYKAMKKTHKKDMGNGGAFTSLQDFAGVTDRLVNKDRELLNESIDERIAASAKQGGGQKEEKPEPYRMSEKLKQSNAVVQRFESLMDNFAFGGGSPYGDGTPLALKSSSMAPQFDTRAAELGYEASNVIGSGLPIDTANTSPLDNTGVLEGAVAQEVSPQAEPAGFSQKFKDDYTFRVKEAMRKNGVKSSTFG